MKIVIDIPGIMYDWFDTGFPDEEDAKMLWDLVKNGTPLPRGHGRLVDADRIYNDFESGDYDFEESLEYAPTIIEADRTESEEV